MGFRVWGLGFRVSGFGFRVSGLGFWFRVVVDLLCSQGQGALHGPALLKFGGPRLVKNRKEVETPKPYTPKP